MHAQSEDIEAAIAAHLAAPSLVEAVVVGPPNSDYYVQFCRGMLEAVSDQFLPPDLHLTPRQQGQLVGLGLSPPAPGRHASPNWYADMHTGGTAEAVARLMLTVLGEVFGYRGETLELTLVGAG